MSYGIHRHGSNFMFTDPLIIANDRAEVLPLHTNFPNGQPGLNYIRYSLKICTALAWHESGNQFNW